MRGAMAVQTMHLTRNTALPEELTTNHQACKGRYNNQIRSGPEQFVVHAAASFDRRR
jgi:hypothetical protein